MKNKRAGKLSSLIISLPVIAINFVLGLLTAFFGYAVPAFILLSISFTGAFSRLWAYSSSRGLRMDVSSGIFALRPGDDCSFDVVIKNESFLPVIWSELFMPVSRSECLVPEDPKVPEVWEAAQLEEFKASKTLVGKENFSTLFRYQKKYISILWHAKRRGIYSCRHWTAASGDGFGLTQIEWPVFRDDTAPCIAVFPQRCRVRIDIFLRNLWNSETSNRGIADDNTVIRNIRDYMVGDSIKSINWRMLAKGGNLSINVPEQIQPGSIHFIFDGQSFAGDHLEEMEDAISILASVIEKLSGKIGCGLSLPYGEEYDAKSIFSSGSSDALLYQLAAYDPFPQVLDEDKNPVSQPAVFCTSAILESVRNTGHYYYIVHDTDDLADGTLINKLDPASTSILSYKKCAGYSSFKVLCLADLKEGDL